MLEFYFDDSGTHGGSSVAVWGGVVGFAEAFGDSFEDRWQQRLKEPCEGRPEIRAFHSSHLAAADGEFEGYSEAERNRTRRNFRQLIVESGLTVVSFGVAVDAWEDLVRGPARLLLGSGERMIFGQAVLAGCAAAKAENEPVAFQFDAGRQLPRLQDMFWPAVDAAHINRNSVSYGYSPVAANVGLQAADLVAHETYRYLVNRTSTPNEGPDIHLKRLFDGAHDARIAWVGREQIADMVREMQPLIEAAGFSPDEVV